MQYGVDKESACINFDSLLSQAKKEKPRMIIAGASAYPRTLDFKKFREVADEVDALLMVDMAHISGLVAAGLHPNPCPMPTSLHPPPTRRFAPGAAALS